MNNNYIFNILIDLIYKYSLKWNVKKLQIKINDKNSFIPKIYYIGMEKSGSTSIINGFLDINIAHWHNVNYFEKIYKTKLLSDNNYDLYDFIIYIGNKFNFKPVLIESIRNPINQEISNIFQHIKLNRKHKYKS